MSDLSEKSIFFRALDFKSDDERSRFLVEACAGNAALQSSVEALLNAHDTSDCPLDIPAAEWRPADGDLLEDTLIVETPVTEDEGTVIDSYRLMEQIGEGGFGLVFVADQQEPVRRRVALKVLKPGMDTREVVARFEAERQALAMMDHPNIASVFGAGMTKTGRPYFVMELVRGTAITEFCDEHQLDMRARLDLFITVCKAVQHAHQKGVIHRDIKPSNVLVTLHDGIPVVKVIDFGVAKAIGQRLTDKTIYTRFTAMIGTPLYMSPEQSEMSGLDIDTRSDIYSLGVLLYELLTGTTPFDGTRLNNATYDELRRIIREEDPPRPSDRLTTLGHVNSTVVTKRRAGFALPSGMVKGDLDWIAMKAMEKNRSRRYESAGSLADDVQRYLNNDVVEARPPSQIYRLQKLARRHKVILTTVSLVAASLLLGIGISVWQAAKAISERNDKEIARQDAVDARNDATAAQKQIEEFAERLKQANILVTSGRAHMDAGRLSSAYDDYSQAIQVQPNYYNAWLERASLQADLGLWEPAAHDFAKALELGVPADNPANWGIAQLFLYAGDVAAYRNWCDNMLQLAKQSPQNISIAAIRSYVMSPTPLIDPAELARLADELLAVVNEERVGRPERSDGRRGPRPDGRYEFPPEDRFGPGPAIGFPGRPPHPADGFAVQDRPGPRPGPMERRGPSDIHRVNHPRGAVAYVAGLAHYRAQNFPQAIERLQTALTDHRWNAHEIVYPALAMAYHRNGQGEEARKAFESSQLAIDTWTEQMLTGPLGAMQFPWFDWIEVKLLHAEASVLLTGYAPAEDPRLRELEGRALTALEQ